jgi:nucleoside diphosphate kinase
MYEWRTIALYQLGTRNRQPHMATKNTFEVNILNGGCILKTSNEDKAKAFFDELSEAMHPERVYLQVWNGAKLVSERISNKPKEN